MITLFILTVFLAELWGGRLGLLWSLVTGFGLGFLLIFYSEKRILNSFTISSLEGQDPWGAVALCEELARRAQIKTPRVIVIQSSAVQSFSVNRYWGPSTVVLTEGLLKSFNSQHLQAVLAYNIASLQSFSSFAFTLTSTPLEFLSLLSRGPDSLFRWLFGWKKNNHSPTENLFFYALSLVGFAFLKVSLSSQTYSHVDKKAVELTDDPQALAEALWRLSGYRFTLPLATPAHLAPLFIVNPLTTKGWSRYFCSQPQTQDRIAKLIGRETI